MQVYLLLDENENVVGVEKLTLGKPSQKHRILEDGENLEELLELPNAKKSVRLSIRAKKDIEDDLTDTKIIVQWLSYALVDMYSVLSDEQKESLAYGDNIAMFQAFLKDPSNRLRVDVEPNQVQKVQKIFGDELTFAKIVEDQYLSIKEES